MRHIDGWRDIPKVLGNCHLSEVDDIVSGATRVTLQLDGADVFIRQVGRGRGARFDVIIEGAEGIVTGLRGMTKQAMRAMGRNNGWEWLP